MWNFAFRNFVRLVAANNRFRAQLSFTGKPAAWVGISRHAPPQRRIPMRQRVVFVSVTFLLFTFSLWAQTTNNSGQTTNLDSGTNSSQNPNSPTGDHLALPHKTTMESGYTKTASTSNQGQFRTEDGCIMVEQADYFLVPQRGKAIHLNSASGQDFSARVGQRVQVHGSETMASNAGASSSTTAGTTGTVAGSSGGNMQAGAGSTGAVGSNTSAGAGAMTAPSTAESQLHQSADRSIAVDTITTVSVACPAVWNPSYPK
jgi:hypothetical protein